MMHVNSNYPHLNVDSDNSRSLRIGEHKQTHTHTKYFHLNSLNITFRIMYTDLCHLLAWKHERNVHARTLIHKFYPQWSERGCCICSLDLTGLHQ